MTDLGVVFRPQLPPERLRAIAELAEESGLDEPWLTRSGVVQQVAPLVRGHGRAR